MGLSSSKSKSTTNEQRQESGTTTPFNLPGVDTAIMNMTDRIGAFGDMDPYSFVAAPAPLQERAWGASDTLADWQPQARLASQFASGVANGGPASIGAPIGWNPAQGQAASVSAPSLGPAATTRPSAYFAPRLGEAATWSAPNAGVGNLVSARGYGVPTIAAPRDAEAQSYNPRATERVEVAPAAYAQASRAGAESLLTNLSAYRNPYDEEVTQRALQDYDLNAERIRAQQAAQAARAGAFGGSRFGLREAQTEAELARERGSLSAGLHQSGFDRAAALSEADTSRRQQSGLFNAQAGTEVALANALAANSRAAQQAGLDSQRTMFDSAASTDAAKWGAESRERASFLNSGQDLQRSIAQAGLDEHERQYNADLDFRAQTANRDSANDLAKFNASLGAQAASEGAAARNAMAIRGAELAADADRYNADTQFKSDTLNTQAANEFSLARLAAEERARQSNAGFAQEMGLANLGYDNQARDSAARFANEFGLANLASTNANLDRRLQAAGMLGDIANSYGAGVRADLGTLAQLGDQQRAIESQYALAPLAQEQALAQLYGITPYGLFAGQNVTGNSTMSGTSTTTQSPSLFNSMLAAASVASKFLPGG